jgi:hypothetical protein
LYNKGDFDCIASEVPQNFKFSNNNDQNATNINSTAAEELVEDVLDEIGYEAKEQPDNVVEDEYAPFNEYPEPPKREYTFGELLKKAGFDESVLKDYVDVEKVKACATLNCFSVDFCVDGCWRNHFACMRIICNFATHLPVAFAVCRVHKCFCTHAHVTGHWRSRAFPSCPAAACIEEMVILAGDRHTERRRRGCGGQRVCGRVAHGAQWRSLPL